MKEKSTLALQALGYHGTTLEAAKKIITDGFRPSSNPWEWLGHGIYFWQDAPNRARDWAKEWHASKGYDGPIAVVAAQIDLHNFVDLLDQVDMELVSEYAGKFESRMTELGSKLTNKYPVHKLDCAVFNFLTNVLSSKGRAIRGYRAACVEGKRITTGSPIYDRSHVQLAVIDQDAISKKWIVENAWNRECRQSHQHYPSPRRAHQPGQGDQTGLQADGRNVRRRVSQTGHTAGSSQGPWRPTLRGAEPGLILFQNLLVDSRVVFRDSVLLCKLGHIS